MSVKTKNILRMLYMWLIALAYVAYVVSFILVIVNLAKKSAEFTAYLSSIGIYYVIALVYILIAKFTVYKETAIIPELSDAWGFIKLIIYPLHMIFEGIGLFAYIWGFSTGVLRRYTGFDLLSVNRFFWAFVVGVAACGLMFLLSINALKDLTYVYVTNVGCLVVVIVCHILWDILDFEHKEHRVGCIIKNIVFGLMVLAAVVYSIIACVQTFGSLEEGYLKSVYQAYVYVGLFGYLFFYMVFIELGNIPESSSKFLPAIAFGCTVVLSLLAGLLLNVSKVLLVILLVIILAGFVLYAIFKGLPFYVASAPYRRKLGTSSSSSNNYSNSSTSTVSSGANLKSELLECSNLKSYMHSQSAYGKHIGQGIDLQIVQVIVDACYFGTCRYRITYKIKVDQSCYLYNGRPDEYAIRQDMNEVERYLNSIREEFKQGTMSKINSLANEYKGYGGRSWTISVNFEKLN
ncbi:MAG: hypothetical protein IJE45_03310 [Bacilli bacterium]|nr:hypothetical protein [Bacilli bacterium]